MTKEPVKKVEKVEKPVAKAEAPKASPKNKRGRGRPPKHGNSKNDAAKKSPKKVSVFFSKFDEKIIFQDDTEEEASPGETSE